MLSLTSNCAPVLCLQLLSTPHFYTLCDQAIRFPGVTSLLSFISDVAVFPNSSLLRDCGVVPLRPSGRGSHQTLPGTGHTQEHSRDCAAADAQRLQLGASQPQKKFTRSCSSSVSHIMENHSTHLVPGFTIRVLVPAPANVVVFQCLLVALLVGRPHSLYQMSSQQGNRFSPCGPKIPGLHSPPGDSPFSPEHHQVASCGVSDSVFPLFIES